MFTGLEGTNLVRACLQCWREQIKCGHVYSVVGNKSSVGMFTVLEGTNLVWACL
jgi:hypothetical protein